jgi:hypothetical protein
LIKKIMYKSTNTGTKVQIVTFSSWCKRDEETRRKQTHLSAARGALAEARSWLQSDVNMQKARAGIQIFLLYQCKSTNTVAEGAAAHDSAANECQYLQLGTSKAGKLRAFFVCAARDSALAGEVDTRGEVSGLDLEIAAVEDRLRAATELQPVAAVGSLAAEGEGEAAAASPPPPRIH